MATKLKAYTFAINDEKILKSNMKARSETIDRKFDRSLSSS